MKKLDQKGQGLTEYLILLMLIAMVSVGVTQMLGKTIRTKLQKVKDEINSGVSTDWEDNGSRSGK